MRLTRFPSPRLAALACAWALLASACSSPLKKAEELFEKGAYGEAVSAFEALAAKEPGNADAVAGLARARAAYVGARLIEVRKARLGGDPALALDSLLELVKKEREWHVSPSGAAVGTQEEEIDEAFGHALRACERDVAAGFPLRAEWRLRHYAPVFQDRYPNRLSAFRPKLTEAGRASCAKLRKEGLKGYPNQAAFVKRYCSLWGKPPADWPDTAELKGSIAKLSSSLGVSVSVQGLPSGLDVAIQSALSEAFRKTGWFDPDGAARAVAATQGSFEREESREPLRLTHAYSVTEKYTELEPQPRVRKIPYTVMAPGPGGGSYPTTQYREEHYTEMVPVTRNRQVPRTHFYSAERQRQRLALTLTAAGKLGGRDWSCELGDSSRVEEVSHDENRPDIGLQPRRPALPDPSAWFRDRAAALGEKCREAVARMWIDLHCRLPAESGASSVSAAGEQAQLCLRQPGTETQPSALAWYEAHLGVTPLQAREVLQ